MRSVTAEWARLRWETLERDDFTCQYCGQRAPDVALQVDHRIAVVDGGTDDPLNLVTACFSCNQGKEYSRWTNASGTAIRPIRPNRPDPPFRGETKTSLVVKHLLDYPQATAKEIAEAVGTTVGAARVMRVRAKIKIDAAVGQGWSPPE